MVITCPDTTYYQRADCRAVPPEPATLLLCAFWELSSAEFLIEALSECTLHFLSILAGCGHVPN